LGARTRTMSILISSRTYKTDTNPLTPIVVRLPREDKENCTMPIYKTKLKSRQEIAAGTMAFRFEKPEGFAYKAGQFADYTLINPSETDAEGNTRGFSLASAPYEDYLMLATRMRDTAFKRVLKTMELLARNLRWTLLMARSRSTTTRKSQPSFSRAASALRPSGASFFKPLSTIFPTRSSFSIPTEGRRMRRLRMP